MYTNRLTERVIDENNPLPIHHISRRYEVLWDTETDFNKGTITDTIISGSSESAAVTLEDTDISFYADFSEDENGTAGKGDLTGTLVGGATVEAGELDVIGGMKYCQYSAVDNANHGNIGGVRLRIRPNYSGNPANNQQYYFEGINASNENMVLIIHNTSGTLGGVVRDSTGVNVAIPSDMWSPSSGQEYWVDFYYDITNGDSGIYVDGVLLGSKSTETGTRTNTAEIIRLGGGKGGNTQSDFKISSVVVFDQIQHSSDFTPTAEVGKSGSYESNIFRTSWADQPWKRFISEYTKPDFSTLTASIRAANSKTALANETYQSITLEQDLTITGRFIQWKIEMSAIIDVPTLDIASIVYDTCSEIISP